MKIWLNDESVFCDGPMSLSEALSAWGYQLDMPMAIALNHEVIHKSALSEYILKTGDSVEILMPMQGG